MTIDVCSLYTNIPNNEGITAVNQALNQHIPYGQNPSYVSLLRLLRMVLTMNNFTFNEKHYLQVGGTAMGTRLAPNYAIITMNQFEDTHVYSYPFQPLLWVRYIYDIFLFWQHDHSELDRFIQL